MGSNSFHMKQNRTVILAHLLFIIGSVLISCNVSKITTGPASLDTESEDSPKIFFLDYQVKRDSLNTTYTARLINMIVTNGTIKDDRYAPIHHGTDDLELIVLDKNQQILTHRYISNPLDRSVEYVNDTGELGRKMIHLDSAQFSVRLPLEPGASSAVLKRFIGDDTESTLLLKTTIK